MGSVLDVKSQRTAGIAPTVWISLSLGDGTLKNNAASKYGLEFCRKVYFIISWQFCIVPMFVSLNFRLKSKGIYEKNLFLFFLIKY